MKKNLIDMTRSFLCACMAFSWWVSCDLPSVIFFGEYPYPTNET